MKRCKNESCKKLFAPQYNSLQPCCGIPCAIEWGRSSQGKKHSKTVVGKENRAEKKKLRENDKSWWTKKAQDEFNKFIRLRDSHLPCISCGITYGQMHSSHYRSVGAAPELRFCEDNAHKGCAQCNNYKSGNIGEYRIQLINKIGIEKVERLEGSHEIKHYTIDDLKEIHVHYQALNKATEAA